MDYVGEARDGSVLINPYLKSLVNTILQAPSPDAPAVLAAKKRIRAMVTGDSSYLFASEIRWYLEEMARVGTEPRVFPLAADLFLDALEASFSSLGPNLFRDHYSGMAGCYQAGDSPISTVQGTFYCIDLVLQKTLELFFAKEAEVNAARTVPLSFLMDEESNYQRSIALFLNLGRQCLQEAVEAALGLSRENVSRCFLDFVVEHRDCMQTLLGRWEAYHKEPGLPDLTNEAYLEGAARVAEEAAYLPLAAAIEELQVRLREQRRRPDDAKAELEEEVHPLYDAASKYLLQGNKEREAEVYDLALRRYNKAAAVFTKIQDRTSTAKVLVERARLFIKSGQDPEAVQEELNKAVCLVLAHMKNFPVGTAATVTHDAAIRFLKDKGYQIEAEAYAAAVALTSSDKGVFARVKP